MRLLLLLLISLSANAADYLTVFNYKNPIERVGGTPINNGELAFRKIWEVECLPPHNKIRDIDTFTNVLMPGGEIAGHYLFSDTPVMCIQMTITDTDGRESDSSQVMKGFDFRTPAPMECM